MRDQPIEQVAVAAQVARQFFHRYAPSVEQCERIASRCGQYQEILMRTQVPVADQFGDADFDVDRPAQFLIARPLGEGCIVGWASRQDA